MQDTFNTPPNRLAIHLGRIGSNPARLIAVADYWAEFDEGVQLLDDPQATFTEDGNELLKLCLASGIAYRPADNGQAMAFPVWLLREFYPANP